ncbi:hypothetical protein OGAPHI_006108 [Ogataea philodendri]|uniref:UBA domain-containing protein n=1 Tax=Ogataea philodendri TaxID=1378263 RepID=A0A9P8NYR2_9ASCO|nr:uncharacterized protein OGAPHI_006108 [Ogataea philodendri]KAH3661929.1 hypothetical protein OGAPHI_006108 [Ogataea philodendri]
MSLQDNVDNLVNMGFDASVARDALSRADNNIEAAVNFIYSDFSADLPPYSENGESGPLGPAGPTGAAGAGGIVADGRSASTAIEIEDDIKNKIASYGYGHDNPVVDLDSDQSKSEIVPTYEVYDDISRYTRAEGDPGVLLPVKAELLEGYFAPLLMTLSNIPAFRDLVLKPEFEDYGYSELWWKKDKCVSNPSVVMETQRLVAFLCGDSFRAFASIRSLIDASSKLMTDDYQSVAEFIQFIYSSLIELFAKTDESLKRPFEQLFTSRFRFEDDETQTHCIFPVESNYFYKDIYRIMHSLLWGKDMGRLGQHQFLELSDVLTVSFEGNGDTVPGGGFELTEEFYPQIYTSKHEHMVADKFRRISELRDEVSKINGQTIQLKAFKGKRVSALLDTTLSHLSSLGEDERVQSAAKELESIANHILDCKTRNTEKLTALNKERSDIDIYNINYILGDQKAEFEPWVLTGVIFNERQFWYRLEEKWYAFNYTLEIGKDFEISQTTFDNIVSQVREYSADNFETGMVLIYVKKSLITTDSPIINKNLQKFIDTDNQKVANGVALHKLNEQQEEQEGQIVLSDQ